MPKRHTPQPTIRIEGNNGGDYLEIKPLEGNLVRLEVGHCCVVTIEHIVPVEFITAMLTDAVLKHGSIQNAIQAISWPKDFTEQLATQVQSNR